MYELVNAAELGFQELERPLMILGRLNGKAYCLYRFQRDQMDAALETLHRLNHPEQAA